MKLNSKIALFTALLVGGSSGVTKAAVITYTDEALFLAAAGTVTTENFDSIVVDTSFNSMTGLDVGPFTVSITGTPSNSAYNFVDAPPIATSESDVNGTTNLRVFTLSNRDFVITFDTAVTSFGADFMNLNDGVLRTEILGSEVTVNPPVQSGFRFFGFTADTAFTSLTFNGLTNDVYGIDNVRFGMGSTAPVPVPATLALFGLGLAGLGMSRRKKA